MALVYRPIADCPACGATQSYGNVLISQDVLHRGCTHCKYWTEIGLPPVRKKVVYLDQSLLSSAFKQGDPRSVQAVNAVSALASKQLLVTPHSNIHESETYQWSGYGGRTPAGLMRFIEQAARGLRFRATYQIEQTQLHKSFLAFLAGAGSNYNVERRDALPRHADDWHNYMYVSVGRRLDDKALVGKMKQQAVAHLVRLFDQWATSTTSLQQDVAAEIGEAAQTYFSQYALYMSRLARGDWDALLDAPVASQYVERLVALQPESVDAGEKLKRVAEYLRSSHFANTPITSLTARIFATLKGMVRAGAFVNRQRAQSELSGIFFDVQHIATYAPYCDAIFVDNQMASLIAQPSVGLALKYGTHVFSLNSRDAFVSWLAEVEATKSPEHASALERAYGSAP